MKKIIIIGGGAAGAKAASKADLIQKIISNYTQTKII